jgi:hypothetical protein
MTLSLIVWRGPGRAPNRRCSFSGPRTATVSLLRFSLGRFFFFMRRYLRGKWYVFASGYYSPEGER